MKTQMKSKNPLAAALALSSLMLVTAGCGRPVAGSYSLIQTESGGALSSTCQGVPLNLSLNENGDSITGSASNQCISETLSGTHSGNQITNVTLTITPVSTQAQQYPQQQYPQQYPQYPQQQYPQTTTGAPAQQVQTCVYVGSLNIEENRISGTLTLTSQPQPGYGSTYSACPTSVTLNGTLR